MKLISIVVPVFNEEKNIPLLIAEVKKTFLDLKDKYTYEIIFIDDGSRDNSLLIIKSFAVREENIKYIEFSRNFGKEAATSAGINNAAGDAVIALDADLQHPIELIPEFLKKWEAGYDVVIGLRTKNPNIPIIKKLASSLYYKIINAISSTPIVSGATDFRLIDKRVVSEFNKFTEHERITRGLIDWLGYRRTFLEFTANERAHGTASYSYLKLFKLAISSSIAHSLFPLKFAGYLGVFIIITSGLGGFVVFVQRYIFDDVLGWSISGTGQLAILMIFFIGIVLACLGLITLYIGNIIHEVSGRPLYVIRDKNTQK
jgi:dolichol-phosphate mannosyltransferase